LGAFMRERWDFVVAPRSINEQRAHKEYLLNVTAVVMGGLATLSATINGIALFWIADVALPATILSVVIAAFCVLAYWLGRRGYVALAGYVPPLVIWGTVTCLLAVGGWRTLLPAGYVLCIILATLLSGLPGGIAIGILSLASYGIVQWQFSQGTLPNLLSLPASSPGIDLFILGTTLIAACIMFHALDRQLAISSDRTLAEMGIYADEMEAIGREREDLIRELREKAERQGELLATVRAISAPVLPVAEGVIVMPMVGKLDPQRAQLLLNDVLEGITTHEADYVLLDLTGMPEIDSPSAQSLVQVIKGARMLGSECRLVGVQSEVAQALTHRAIDLSEVATYRTLREGISALLVQRMTDTLPT
jgi:anti-anti-sigma regulatory factor